MAYKAEYKRTRSEDDYHYDHEGFKSYEHSPSTLRKLKLTSLFLAFTTFVFGVTTLLLWTQISHCALSGLEVGVATAPGMKDSMMLEKKAEKNRPR